ncbi:MAG: ATP-binding protein, partial [Planctomycetota bacterium]
TRAHDAHGKPGLDPGEDVTNCRLRGVQDALESLRTQRRGIQGELGDMPGETLAQWVQSIIENVRKDLRQDRKKLDEVNESLKRIKSKRDRLASQVREYQNQEGRRKALEEVNDGLRSKSLEVRAEMDVHRLLLELLEETIESVRLRTGPSLGKGLCRLLPHLTGGRYRDAQVTRDFEIKLFTGAKSDFLQSHELSGGTLQGLTFGFRLAFAQAYVRAVTGAPQFLFLDEPFPAMDRDRVLHTLRALPRLSRELSQIFVAHPDLEEEARNCFDHILDTELGSGELSHDFSMTGNQRPHRVAGDLGKPRSLPGAVKEKRTSARKPSQKSSEKREVAQRKKPEKGDEREKTPNREAAPRR